MHILVSKTNRRPEFIIELGTRSLDMLAPVERPLIVPLLACGGLALEKVEPVGLPICCRLADYQMAPIARSSFRPPLAVETLSSNLGEPLQALASLLGSDKNQNSA